MWHMGTTYVSEPSVLTHFLHEHCVPPPLELIPVRECLGHRYLSAQDKSLIGVAAGGKAFHKRMLSFLFQPHL